MRYMQLFTVSQIAQYVRSTLERDPVLRDLWVNGEVSNLFRSSAGHAYFTLKEGTDATIRCVLFSGNRGAEFLADGAAANVHGRVSFYETRGDLQLYADMVQPAGLGLLALELERLNVQLEAEGLFDPTRKRPLPPFPKRIGLVTSEQGAVFHDICTIVERRYPLAEIVLCPAGVQGAQAAPEIVAALRTLNAETNMDVIIVGRGGGSLEDLWTFNTEAVARAIYASRVPVVSAVGHETDVTIADMVADYRAPTPSAAAEAVTPDAAAHVAEIWALGQRAGATLSYHLSERAQGVESLVRRMQGRVPNVASLRQQVDEMVAQGWGALQELIGERRERAQGLELRLQALHPTAVLGRGYAMLVHEATGATVTSVAEVKPGDLVKATVKDGQFTTRVER